MDSKITVAQLFTMKPHPYADMFPAAYGKPYEYLLASVRKLKRLRNPVIVFQGMILDGNQRIRACREARVEPRFKEFEGTEAEAFELVWDLNFARRQLLPSQWGAIIAKYTLFYEQGDRRDLCPGTHTTEEMADRVGVSRATVQRAKTVLRSGTEEEKKALESGTEKAKPLAEKIRQRENQSGNGELVDANGIKIPAPAIPFWNRKSEVKGLINQINSVKREVRKIPDGDPMYSEVNLNGVAGSLNDAVSRLQGGVPEHVCPYCDGLSTRRCEACKGRGVVSRDRWKMAPEELRKKK